MSVKSYPTEEFIGFSSHDDWSFKFGIEFMWSEWMLLSVNKTNGETSSCCPAVYSSPLRTSLRNPSIRKKVRSIVDSFFLFARRLVVRRHRANFISMTYSRLIIERYRDGILFARLLLWRRRPHATSAILILSAEYLLNRLVDPFPSLDVVRSSR